uniref:Oxidoreductase domain protein n=1 Tax=Sphingobacterium sp. (strain 21) TaxID=743722 RepID=F4C3J9_SPHS2
MNSIPRRDFIKKATISSLSISLLNLPLTGKASFKNVNGKRVGIIGLDTSHSIAFAKALNAATPDAALKGYRIIAAYPYGSRDIESSAKRIAGYTQEISTLGIEIVDSIADLLKKVDHVLLETNDGRLHLEQAIPVIDAGKTLFIDKPMAASYRDAKKIFEYARKKRIPVFSASSLRYAEHIKEITEIKSIGDVTGADTYSPATLEATHPDLFWYGIHGVETLYAVMGRGCKSVTRTSTPDTDIVVGTWSDGRLGTFRGIRKGKRDFGGTAFGTTGIQLIGPYKGYQPLLEEIVQFFETKRPPVQEEETLEILAFMEAADLSKSRAGAAVFLHEIMQ